MGEGTLLSGGGPRAGQETYLPTYSSAFSPGPVGQRRRRRRAVSTPPGEAVRQRHLGGSVLAWRRSDVTPIHAPAADPSSVTLTADFRHRLQSAESPPTRVGVAYGRHRFNGKVKVVRAIATHAVRCKGAVIAGDLNATPHESFQAAGRRRGVADDELALLTAAGGVRSAEQSLADVVPLGHDHANGEYSRVTYQ